MENGVLEIFFSFVDEDDGFYQQIKAQLSFLERKEQLRCTSKGDIQAGDEVANVMRLLERAAIIALLISPAYLRSDKHYHELERAMEISREGRARVVPILLKPADYEDAPFAGLQVLPSNGQPISQWYGRSDEAFNDVGLGIKRLVQKLQGLPTETSSISPDQAWTVPYARNLLFTGRQAELQAIETTFAQGQNAAVSQTQAISGLGGIGKTQLALEYAYRHREKYRYVFWVLADTRDTLNAHYSQLAELLNLPGKDQAELRYIIAAVKSWLAKNQGWLLILDNADDLAIIQDFLPLSTAPGHILLTTRSHALHRLAKNIAIDNLAANEGCDLLLRRSGLLEKFKTLEAIPPKEREAAQKLTRELDGLPLALDQAGAYVEETSCGLQGYFALYQKQHKELLRVRGGLVADHPASVTQTVQLAFARLKTKPEATDLLRLCAFLAPEDIPEMLIEEGESELTGPLKKLARSPMKLNATIAELQKYSLISRNAAMKTLNVHRLVQMVLRDSMTRNVEQAWVVRVIRVLDRVFPWAQDEDVNEEYWQRYRQLMPHIQECAELINHWQMTTLVGTFLLRKAGEYLWVRGEYSKSQIYYEQGLGIVQKTLGKEHPITANFLSGLSDTYGGQGQYEQAVDLYKQALTIGRNVLGEEHIGVIAILGNLGLAYSGQKKYQEAESLFQQALALSLKNFGEDNVKTAKCLNNLAEVYLGQGKYEEAERFHRQAQDILQRALGQKNPLVATSLNNRGELYLAQGRYAEARDLLSQALAIQQEVFDDVHPNTARSLYNLGRLSLALEAYTEALSFFQQALKIYSTMLGEEHPETRKTRLSYEEVLLRAKH